MKNRKPIIGISMGDPSSIGPEITLKSLAEPSVHKKCKPVIIGNSQIMGKIKKLIGLDLQINTIDSISQAIFKPDIVNIININNVDCDNHRMGEISAMSGNAAFEYVVKLIDLAMKEEIDATVTGPIHKESINMAGHPFSGHTEIYAHYTKTKKYAMLLVEENLRVIHVSTHVSLRDACNLVKKERILETIELLDQGCRSIGVWKPKIAVAGLNPHSSDGGLFGNEEEKEIIPAIKEANMLGYDVEGPVPPDTLFPKAIGGVYDGCVAMYHDQGHIPFKVNGFNWDREKGKMKNVRGVNITLGLPIIRTSVDHGTAMEIAGKNIASSEAMLLAIDFAIKLFKNKNDQS